MEAEKVGGGVHWRQQRQAKPQAGSLHPSADLHSESLCLPAAFQNLKLVTLNSYFWSWLAPVHSLCTLCAFVHVISSV